MLKITINLLFLSTLILTACNNQSYTEKGIDQIVQTTDSLLADLTGQKYEWASKSAYSTIMAYYPTTDLIFLNESYNKRSFAEAVNFYYFKDRAVVRYVSKMLEYLKQDNGHIKKRYLRLTINFDPDGDVISYEKLINGKVTGLSSEETEEILSHSRELYAIVGDEE